MGTIKTVEEAREFLKEKGFYTDNLWSVYDVQSSYGCTTEQAQEILHSALKNEATMEQIWFAINLTAEEKGLIKIEQDEQS